MWTELKWNIGRRGTVGCLPFIKAFRLNCYLGISASLCVMTLLAQAPPSVEKSVDQILQHLKSPMAHGPAKERAAEDLRRLGTNTLAILLKRVKAVDQIDGTNASVAVERKLELQAAFQVLGREARPILPELIQEFRMGRSLGNTM